jgi:predicted nucleic acid-binding Zn ribbon protein
MPTYLYETVPSDTRTAPQRFEIQQSMNDPVLTQHPETGEPIRRVILGGYGLIEKTKPTSSQSGCCGPSGCC